MQGTSFRKRKHNAYLCIASANESQFVSEASCTDNVSQACEMAINLQPLWN